MDILRRNTDYAVRAMIYLAKYWQREPISTRRISEAGDIPYQLTCKLMQRLHKAKFIDSCMGPKGGFRLSRKPESIDLLEIVKTIQGPIYLNRCLVDMAACVRQSSCPVTSKLAGLQKYLESSLSSITLDQLCGSGSSSAAQ